MRQIFWQMAKPVAALTLLGALKLTVSADTPSGPTAKAATPLVTTKPTTTTQPVVPTPAFPYALYSLDKDRMARVTGFLGLADDPFQRNNIIRAQDALVLAQMPAAQRDKIDVSYSDDQKKLIALVVLEQKSSHGRELAKIAADADYWLVISTTFAGGGYCQPDPDYKLIAFEIDDKDAANAWASVVKRLLQILFHEETHVAQAVKWKILLPPPDSSSFDRAMWSLGIEEQAVMAEDDATEILEGPLVAQTPDERYKYFVDLFLGDQFHDDFCHVDNGRFDGTLIPVEDFVKAFGSLVPGDDRAPNFLKDHFTSRKAMFDILVHSNPRMERTYQRALLEKIQELLENALDAAWEQIGDWSEALGIETLSTDYMPPPSQPLPPFTIGPP